MEKGASSRLNVELIRVRRGLLISSIIITNNAQKLGSVNNTCLKREIRARLIGGLMHMGSRIKKVHGSISMGRLTTLQALPLGMLSILLIFMLGFPHFLRAQPHTETITKEEALRLGEEFGIVVGEVDKEIQQYLGLERSEGVVVFEVLGGKPAALAGIKPRSLIKEINSVEIRNLKDFGLALREALPTENFTVATYEPADPDDQGISGGINFHFVRVEKI